MSDATAMLKELSQPWRPGEFVKDAIGRVAPLAGMSVSRAGDIWYGKARKIEERELANLAEALNKKNKRSFWNELQQIKLQIARLEEFALRNDPDLDRASAAQGGQGLRVAGGTDRAVGGRRA